MAFHVSVATGVFYWAKGGAMKYSDKLKDPRWQARRLEILTRDEFSCKRCYSEDDVLNVHHLKYLLGLEPWEYCDDDLITLCQACHKAVSQYRLPEEEIKNPWITYDRMKKRLCIDGYRGSILELCNSISL